MTDIYEENAISINDSIKSVSVACLEEAIAKAIAKSVGNDNIACHIARLEVSNSHGVKIKLELTDID